MCPCSRQPQLSTWHVAWSNFQCGSVREQGRAELGIHSLFALASGVLFIMSGAIGALLRCLPLAMAVVLGHAAFRRAATEDRTAGVDFR